MEKLSIFTVYYLNTIRYLMNKSLILQASSTEGFIEVTRSPNCEVYAEALKQNHASVWDGNRHKVPISTQVLQTTLQSV